MRSWLILGISAISLCACASDQKFPVLEPAKVEPPTTQAQTTPPDGCPPQININIASEEELRCLPGIGLERIDDIVQGRPYWAVEDLLKKKILPESIYEPIAGMLVVN